MIEILRIKKYKNVYYYEIKFKRERGSRSMKFKFKRIISLIMTIATVFTLAGSNIYAADSGGHASVGGSTVPGHYSQASSSQIGAGVTATDTASGLKLSVIRTDYSADTKADDVSAYESGILYGHTVLSGPASYNSEASEFLGTMPIYFRNQSLSEKSISTEAYQDICML